MTLRAVLEQLVSEQRLLATTIADIEKPDVPTLWTEQSPWYVRTLIGVSAWIAAILFLLFIFGTNAIDSGEIAAFLGVVLLIVTTLTRWKVDQIFINQLMLAFHLVGQVMVIMGVSDGFDNNELAAALTLILEILVIFVYRDGVMRFLATLFAYAAIVSLGYLYEIPNALHALIVLSASAVGLLWHNESRLLTTRFAPIYLPARYGVTLALLLLLIPSMLPDISVTSWWISTVGLFIALLWFEYRLLARYAIAPFEQTGLLLMGCTAALTLPLLTTPGILAAVLVLVLGFQRGQRVLMGLALVFLVVFLIAFYYHLDVTLLVKSGILTASGGVMLGMRWALLRQFNPAADDGHAHA